ncbi:hypothetical protein LCGC14_1733120 [marine sediment metagenome]|uniref:Uncharacterized protein n=1 Tax=marine sediment metagenome TaxID=412755 RepID=A0A0F9HWL2_9ZZZZ
MFESEKIKITKKEYDILKGVLYGFDCMLASEADANHGDATEWKQVARMYRNKYDEWEANCRNAGR